MIEEFNKRDTFVLAIMPEGTRSGVQKWRSGFYYIAQGAGVPIVLVILLIRSPTKSERLIRGNNLKKIYNT